MRSRSVTVGLTMVFLGASVSLAGLERPLAVSPGTADGFARIADRCPTFSWGSVEGADLVELVVYKVAGDELEEAEPVVAVTLPGSVQSWTPALDQCLQEAGQYAWFLRAVLKTGAASWSVPRLFQLAAEPSEAEFRTALAVVEAYLLRTGSEIDRKAERSREGSAAAEKPEGGMTRHTRASNDADLVALPDEIGIRSDVVTGSGVTFGVHGISRSAADGSAGMVGESTAVSGDTAGVVGQVASAAGAAGVFDNSAGGDILRGLKNGVELVTVDGVGTITAVSFAGSGSGLTDVSADEADTLDALDSNQFLRSDKSDSFTSGELSTSPGTILDVEGSLDASGATALSLPSANINGAGPGSGLDADKLDGLESSDIFGAGSAIWVDRSGDTMTGDLNLDGANVLKGGTLFVHDNGADNTALGISALGSSVGTANTAVGEEALLSNAGGNKNTAVGTDALRTNTAGNGNTAIGEEALRDNTQGTSNTAVGENALRRNINAHDNTAVGQDALEDNTTGLQNTAVGENALTENTTGSRNLGLGNRAGEHLTTGSDNIHLANSGIAGESATIRIGTQGTQTRAFVAGIRGVTTDLGGGLAVLIDPAGQLGTASSSRRYKEDIQDIGDLSRRLLALRPVTFRYKHQSAEGENSVEFGLIAEEVAKVLPDLVVYNNTGQPETVRYHLLSVLLLNEFQRLERQMAAWEASMDSRSTTD